MYNPQTDEQKKRILQQMKQNEQMARYQKAKRQQQITSAPKQLNNISKNINNYGKMLEKGGGWLAQRQNPYAQSFGQRLNNFGQGMQKYSGQSQLNGIKEAMSNKLATLGQTGNATIPNTAISSGIQGVAPSTSTLATSGALGSTAGTGASALGSELAAQTAATTAGTTAATGAGSSALASGISAAAPAATTTAAGAGTGAATTAAAGSAAIPVAGWIAAAAILAANQAKAFKDQKDKQAQVAAADEEQKAIMNNTNAFNENRNRFDNNLQALSGMYSGQDSIGSAINNEVNDSDKATRERDKTQDVLTGVNLFKDFENMNTTMGDKIGLGSDATKAFNLGNKAIQGLMKLNIPYQIMNAINKSNQKAMEKALTEGNRSERISQENLANDRAAFEDIAMQNLSNAVNDNNINQQTQPTNNDLTQSIMSQVQPEQGPNLNDLMSSYINTPDTTQTLQNGPSTPMENEGMEVGGASNVGKTDLEKSTDYFFENDTPTNSSGYEGTLPDIQNIQVAGGPTLPSGPTVGNDTITPEDTTTDYKQGLFDRIKQGLGNGLKDAYNGYQDNLKSSLMEGDLVKGLMNNEVNPSVNDDGTLTGGATEDKKSIMNRIGEAVGTAQRIASNPYAQGLVSTGLALKDGENLRDALTTGINWASNKAKSDYYQKQINPDSTPSIMGNYDKDDYNAKVNSDYKKEMTNIQSKKAEVDKQYKEHKISLDERNYKIKELETKEKIAHNKAMEKIAEKNANTNAARVNESTRHNKAMEGISKSKNNKTNYKQQRNSDFAYYNSLSDAEKKIAREYMLNNYFDDFLKTEGNGYFLNDEDED